MFYFSRKIHTNMQRQEDDYGFGNCSGCFPRIYRRTIFTHETDRQQADVGDEPV